MLGSGNLGLVYVPGPPAHPRGDRRALAGPGPGLVAHPGVGFVAARRGRPGRDRRPAASTWAPAWSRKRPAGAVRRPRAGDAADAARCPRPRSSTSTAASTPARWRWPRSSRWSAATAASAAGRTGASCWPHPPARPDRADRRRRALHRRLVGILEPSAIGRSWRGARHDRSRTTNLLDQHRGARGRGRGMKAASDIVGPVMLALALTIVFHPLRSVSSAGCRRGPPPWSSSSGVRADPGPDPRAGGLGGAPGDADPDVRADQMDDWRRGIGAGFDSASGADRSMR